MLFYVSMRITKNTPAIFPCRR